MFHLNLALLCHKKMCQVAKPVYLKIYTDFCRPYFQTIKSDGSHHTMSCVVYIIQTGNYISPVGCQKAT